MSEQCFPLTLQNIKAPHQFQVVQRLYWQGSLYSLVDWTEISHGDQRCLQMLRYGFTCFLRLRVCVSACVRVCVVQQSLSKLPSDKSRSKRNKEPKPRVKKLKYHQYIPPDRKQEPSEVQMDSAYARLLQQQQQFLQLQILSQQQFNFQASPSVNIKYGCFTNTNTPVVSTHTVEQAHAAAVCQGGFRFSTRRMLQTLYDEKLAGGSDFLSELYSLSLPVPLQQTDSRGTIQLFQHCSGWKRCPLPCAAPAEPGQRQARSFTCQPG